MTDDARPAAPVAGANSTAAQPTFLRSLRGIWLFTWKVQLTWRRLPVALLSLLVLPVLVYLTISPTLFRERPLRLTDPLGPYLDLEAMFSRVNMPLTPDQKKEMRRIFSEEFARAEARVNRARDSGEWTGQEGPYLRACYVQIQSRLRGQLDDRQFAELRQAIERRLERIEQREGSPRWSRHAAFYHWLIDFYFFIVLPLNCVRLSGALIRDELQADTLGFLLTRPLSRGKLVLAKYLSQTAWLQIVLMIETLLLFGAGGVQKIAGIGSLVPLFLATQFLAVFAWSALGLFLGLVTNRYIAMALVYGAIVEMGIGSIPTNINTLSVMRHLKSLLVRNDVVQGIFDWQSRAVPYSVGALLLAAAVFLGLATLLFTLFEYHHTAEMQK